MRLVLFVNLIFLSAISTKLSAQESVFANCAVGVIVDAKENIYGSGFVAFSEKNVVTCAHVVQPIMGQVYFHPFMSEVLVPVSIQAVNDNSDLVILKANTDVCSQPLKVNIDYPSSISDTISYVGVSLKNSNDSVASIEVNSSVVALTGKYRGDFGSSEFVEFPGRGEPGFSGSPVLNKKGEVIAVIAQAFYLRGVRSKTEQLFNRAVLFPKGQR